MIEPESNERPLSILVVDDDGPVRETMCWMLQDAGYSVHEAADATEALDYLGGPAHVDLVISDINMPGVDGMELSRRARRRWPHIPVILVSGRPPPSDATPFLSKPFDWRTLANAIAKLAHDNDWHALAPGD